MKPEMDAHVLIGGIPYPCRRDVGEPVGDVHFVELLEPVGDSNTITPDEATTHFGEGTILCVKWDGVTRHPTTDFPVFKMTSPPGIPRKGR